MSATPSLLPWIAGLLVVIPWMNPFTGGPSAAAIPWLVSAACGIGLFMLSLTGSVGRVHWPLVAGSAGLVAWAALSHPTVSDGATALAAGLMLVCLAATAVTVDGVGRAMRGGLLLAAALSAVFGLLQYMGVSQVFDPWVNYAPRGEAYGNLRQPNL